MDATGRPCLTCQPSSRTGENPPYGMIGGTVETSASFEARYAPLSHPTAGGGQRMIVPTATLKPAGRGSLLTACGYTHIHGNLTGVCGLGGAFQQKEGEIGGQGLGTQPPNHRSDLATMIRGVVGQMLHEVR